MAIVGPAGTCGLRNSGGFDLQTGCSEKSIR
jgi:hypothetical protein